MNDLDSIADLMASLQDEVNAFDALKDKREDSIASLQDQEAKIKRFYRMNRNFIRWGLQDSMPTSYQIGNTNSLLDALEGGYIDGTNTVSEVFINSAFLIMEKPIRNARVKTSGGIQVNAKALRISLGISSKQLARLKSIYGKEVLLKDERTLSFIDKTVTVKWLVYKLLIGFQAIINNGYRFKNTKRFDSICKLEGKYDSRGLVEINIHRLVGLKPSSDYRIASRKDKTRAVYQLKHGLVVGMDITGSRIVSISKYTPKELPLYLKD